MNENDTEDIIHAVKSFQIDLGLIFGSEETYQSRISTIDNELNLSTKINGINE